ncbi:Uncharacterised protein [Mycobacteroides abscessus subsp. abscessus]|nr:Uncharacterised protein [Mycobacteroides abscessus subsp. abscessus]
MGRGRPDRVLHLIGRRPRSAAGAGDGNRTRVASLQATRSRQFIIVHKRTAAQHHSRLDRSEPFICVHRVSRRVAGVYTGKVRGKIWPDGW